MAELGAIVLAGGRATRLGGIDKPALELDGETLLGRAVAAAREGGAAPVVVVGPRRPGSSAVWTRESPTFSGPVAALAAGLQASSAQWLLVLAADARRPRAVVHELLAAQCDADGVLLVDDGDRPQWLCGLYRRAALTAALAELGDPSGASMGRLLSGLRLARRRVRPDVIADVDSPSDARDAGIALPTPRTEADVSGDTPSTER